MSKLEKIIEGWKNVIFPSLEVKKIAIERANICSSCEYNKLEICSKCGCPLVAKIRSLKDNCPINKW